MSVPTRRDRTVHGRTSDGREIVRYDRAGKWYAEAPDAVGKGSRTALTITEAVELASNGVAYLGRSGGKQFDAKVVATKRKD